MSVFAQPAADVEVPREPGRPRALRVRRGFLIASPVLAGLFCVIGAWSDPAVGITGARLYELYAAHPEPLQLKSLGFHWGYAFWMLPALLAAAYVRGRGAWIANVAAFIGFAGMTTLPGLLIIDYYDSAIGQEYGVRGSLAVEDRMEQMWGLPAFALPGLLGLMISLPLIAIALWRGGVIRWWGVAAVAGGQAVFLLGDIAWWHCAIMTGFFAVFAYALALGTRGRTEL
ncbi:MAG TPA: hypothetical protein VFJ28_13770 [Marmoricola sp.]|nr:hypothetical protein [Marmoricola sp.]